MKANMSVEAQFHSTPRHRMGVTNHLHAPAAFFHGKEPWYPLTRKLGDPRGGLDVLEKRKFPGVCW
jgi:hypothetical protein